MIRQRHGRGVSVRRLVLAVAAIAFGAVSVAMTSPSSAATGPRNVRDYAPSTATAGPAARVLTADPATGKCDTSHVQGGWICDSHTVPTRIAGAAHPDAVSYFCNDGACYDVCYGQAATICAIGEVDNQTFGYTSGGASKILGTATINGKWSLRGRQWNGTLQERITAVSQSYSFSGDVYGVSTAFAAVHSLSYSATSQGGVPGGRTVTYNYSGYATVGYYGYSSPLEASWEIAGYPGYWFQYMYSPVTGCNNDSCVFQPRTIASPANYSAQWRS